MKIVFTTILLLSLSACTSKFAEWPEAKAGMKASEPLIEAVKAYHAQEGKPPSSLDEFKLSEAVMADLDQHRIHYLMQKNQSEYGVVFRSKEFSSNRIAPMAIVLKPGSALGSNDEELLTGKRFGSHWMTHSLSGSSWNKINRFELRRICVPRFSYWFCRPAE